MSKEQKQSSGTDLDRPWYSLMDDDGSPEHPSNTMVEIKGHTHPLDTVCIGYFSAAMGDWMTFAGDPTHWRPLSTREDPENWFCSDKPMPCPCGGDELNIVSSFERNPKRVVPEVHVQCLRCSSSGPRAYLGPSGAARRWNWMWWEVFHGKDKPPSTTDDEEGLVHDL